MGVYVCVYRVVTDWHQTNLPCKELGLLPLVMVEEEVVAAASKQVGEAAGGKGRHRIVPKPNEAPRGECFIKRDP